MNSTKSSGSRSAANLFADLSETTAPPAARPLLTKSREIFGFVPNLAITMAAVPATLEGYFHVLQAFGDTPLTPIEQQIVLMSASHANQADYSLAIHAAFATKLGADPVVVKAVVTGESISDDRLAALRRFTEVLTIARGRVSASEVDAFLAAGYERAAIVAVAFGVAVKTFANTLAHLAKTPVDDAFASAFSKLRS
jgi:alkylhydroperoxidase family enzyme